MHPWVAVGMGRGAGRGLHGWETGRAWQRGGQPCPPA